MSVYVLDHYNEDGAKVMRPVLTREEYLALRNSNKQKKTLSAIRGGDKSKKNQLLQMNYSCVPGDDGLLRGCKTPSNSVGMDIDFVAPAELSAEEQQAWLAGKLTGVPELVLSKREELGLHMLERSASKGYHLVFRRRPELSQEGNLLWASELLGIKYDDGAKDITRVFYSTTADEENLIFLSDEIFEIKECEAIDDVENTDDSDIEDSAEMKFPDSFKGVPYATIIAEYWRRTGGEPNTGERNKRLHKLAANLRAICDDSEEWLLEIMPRYGLSLQEMKGIIHSACKEPTKGSRLIDQIVSALEMGISSDEIEDAEAVAAETGVKVNVKALPIGLKESLAGVPVTMHMPVLCGVLPIAAAYADQVQIQYCDGNLQHLGLMSIIRGEQASNKSVVKNAVDVWKRQFDEEDALARKREEEWKERKKGRKANEKAPEDPHVLIRMVPVTVSCSTLLKRFKNAQGHTIYSFGEELDTLRKTNGAGSWSSKYDIYRLSFDKGEWGQDYNSDAAESGVVKVAYNWTMLGTNGAMRKCFKSDNIENGLSSRILVAEMPDSSFSKMPKFGRRSAEDEAKIQEAVTCLRSYSGLVDTPRLRKAIEEWVEQKRVEAAKDIDHVKDTYRKRAAVIGFRCGVIFHLLSGKDKETKACLDFALMMADYCLMEQIKTFGEALQSQYVDAREECQRYGANHSVFDQLAPTFTIDDLRALKRGYCSETAMRMIISRWMRDGWISKTDRHHWSKRQVGSAAENVTK